MDSPHPESNNRDDIAIIYEEQLNRKVMVQRSVDSLRIENTFYKKKCQSLQQRLDYLNKLIEKNAQIFQKLYVDSKCILEMTRLEAFVNTPIPEKSAIVSSTPKPGPSHRVSIGDERLLRHTVRPRLHIEPMNMNELQQTESSPTENHEVEIPPAEVLQEEGLSVIPEETAVTSTISLNEASSDVSVLHNLSLDQLNRLKDLVVNVEKMPSDIFSFHLKKNSNKGNNSTSVFNISDSFTNTIVKGPECSSTPLKLEMMKMLGLTPIQSVANNNFVNVRKKAQENQNGAGPSHLVNSPKKEKTTLSPLKENSNKNVLKSPKRESLKRACSQSPDYVNKRKRTNPEAVSPRPTRLSVKLENSKTKVKRELLSTSSRTSSMTKKSQREIDFGKKSPKKSDNSGKTNSKASKNPKKSNSKSKEHGSKKKSSKKHNSENTVPGKRGSGSESPKKHYSDTRNPKQRDSNRTPKKRHFENGKPIVESRRPARKAKPQEIKEPSLKRKMRR